MRSYTTLSYKDVYDRIMYILYYILAYVQHKGMSHLKITNACQRCIHKYENIKLCVTVLYIYIYIYIYLFIIF